MCIKTWHVTYNKRKNQFSSITRLAITTNTCWVLSLMYSWYSQLIVQLYYKQKGSRHVTRPQAIHDSFETSADVIVSKLQSYYNQADEYHNQCLQGKVCIFMMLKYAYSFIWCKHLMMTKSEAWKLYNTKQEVSTHSASSPVIFVARLVTEISNVNFIISFFSIN